MHDKIDVSVCVCAYMFLCECVCGGGMRVCVHACMHIANDGICACMCGIV